MIRLTCAGFLATLALLGPGCAQPHLLDPRWLPLREVVERADLPGLSPTASTTLGARVYVADLGAWLERYPPGSVDYEALLAHEREHARRQAELGLDVFLARYLNDPAFQWAEEQRGWFLELTRLQVAGRPIVPVQVALALSRYDSLAGPMVSYPDALTWVQDVLSGRWTPPEVPRD